MKRKKRNEESEEQLNLKKLMSTPRGKAVVFFGAYFVFFLLIAIAARTGGPAYGDSRNRKYQTGTENRFSYASIESNNFNFQYTIDIDGVSSTYTGVRTGKKERIISFDKKEYYLENGNYFLNSNGLWLKAENPYKYTEFYEVNIIKELVQQATYMSNTNYESGRSVYNYSISSATISIGADEDNYVNSVKYVLDSYCKVRGICVNSMSITLNYEQYGKIEELTSPLE